VWEDAFFAKNTSFPACFGSCKAKTKKQKSRFVTGFDDGVMP
jgi:hypothetical protein